MSPRRLARIALHLLLAVSLVATGVAAPVQAIAGELGAMAQASQASQATAEAMPGMADMGDMPCDHMQMARNDAKAPAAQREAGEGCAGLHCIEACLGVACLPAFRHVAMQIAPNHAPAAWMPIPRLARMIDTPLRPPIA